jgi:hypothetical protein
MSWGDGVPQLRTAFSQQLPRRINQRPHPAAKKKHVRSEKGGALRVNLLPKRSVVACTTQIISGSKRQNIGNLPKLRKTPPPNRSFSNWLPFVKRWQMKSMTAGQVDSRIAGGDAPLDQIAEDAFDRIATVNLRGHPAWID